MNSNLRSKKPFVAIFFCFIFVVRQSCFKSIALISSILLLCGNRVSRVTFKTNCSNFKVNLSTRSVSESLQNFNALISLLLEPCWIEFIIFLCKLLYRKTEKSFSLTTAYTLSIWKSALKSNFSRHLRSTKFFV